MVIDTHAHFIPPAYRRVVTRRGLVPFELPETPLDGALEFMDAHAIDAMVLSLTPPGVAFGDQGLADELARMVNEATAAAVASAPERLAGLAVVPLPDTGRAIEEVRHALDVLRLDGVALLSNVLGRYPADFAPLLDELDERGAYVLLHPAPPPYELPIAEHPVWLYEFPFETTRAIAGMGGRWPRLRLQASHLGGTLPFLAARFDHGAWLRRVYYDTALSDDPAAIAAAQALAGPEHVVFGSDWPFVDAPGAPGSGTGAALVPRLVRAVPA